MKTTFTKNNRKVRALIIEDAKINAVVLSNALKHHGIFSHWVLTKEQAIEELCETSYDIVFLDHFLSENDSGELLEYIKREYPNVDVISYTGAIYTLRSIKEFLSIFPYDDIITKPFANTHLERILMSRYTVEPFTKEE